MNGWVAPDRPHPIARAPDRPALIAPPDRPAIQ